MEDSIFRTIVKNTPLVSIDLIIYDTKGRVLLGLRTNEPAKGIWFIPGGRINKNETFAEAFRRISKMETGVEMDPDNARFKGVYQHMYDTNYMQEPGYGTHYIVLAFEITLKRDLTSLPDEQHSQYRWLSPVELVQDPQVHAYTKVYFGNNPRLTLIAAGYQ